MIGVDGFSTKLFDLVQKGWLAIAKLKPLSLFISLFNREMKSESGYRLAAASQPFNLFDKKKIMLSV